MRGFSVLELIVAAALGLLLLGVCIQFLIPSLNVTARETARSQMQERASMVLRQLATLGLPAARMRAIAYADTKPVGSNGTAEGRAGNRRVELVISSPTAPLPQR